MRAIKLEPYDALLQLVSVISALLGIFGLWKFRWLFYTYLC